jgi:excisionase family DNA binding protein
VIHVQSSPLSNREEENVDAINVKDPTVGMLNVDQVADRLGLSKQSVYRAAARGTLPSRRWNRKLIFLESDLKQFFHTLPMRPVTQPVSGRKARDE